MLQWKLERVRLDLKYSWKISRNTSDHKINFIVTAADDYTKAMGEAAPNIRYGETAELIEKQFEAFLAAVAGFTFNLQELSTLLRSLQICNSLRFGIESAYVHYLCSRSGITVNEYFNLPLPGRVHTSFSLPIMDPADIAGFIKENRLERFKYLKVKTNKESAFEIIKEVARHAQQPLYIDGNECWDDADVLLRFMERLREFKIVFMEQPMPASCIHEYIYLKQKSPFELIADESVTDDARFDELYKQFHGINMKLMKAGGYLNGIRLLEEAVKFKMKTMVGCMVETSLGISSALQLCHNADYIDLDGFLIVKTEPFGLVEENDGLLQLVKK